MSDQEKEPKMEEEKRITIRVRDQENNTITFKIRRSTKMERVFGAYAKKMGAREDDMRFVLEGERLNPEQTAAELDLRDNDVIDVMVKQIGGF